MTTQNSTRSGLPERSVLVAFLLFIVVGGGASVAIRATYAEMAPFWAAASRFVLGALAMWTIAFFRRIPLPKGQALVGALLFGTLTVGLAFLLISWGLVATPASRYQILMATVPLRSADSFWGPPRWSAARNGPYRPRRTPGSLSSIW